VDPGAAYECDRVVFEPGCRMVLYTDGVTDAFSASSEEPFGIDRLGSAIARHATVPSRDLLRTLNRLLDSWVGNEPHTDDVTMMAVRRVDTGRRGEHN
jgi:sigma-B regulation protein RsbU (phosphoserine phosphatase)